MKKNLRARSKSLGSTAHCFKDAIPSPDVTKPKTVRLSLITLLTASPARPEPIVLPIHECPNQIALRADSGDAGSVYWASFANWGQQAAVADILRGGAAMGPVPVATPGSLAGPCLVPGGFFQIDVADAGTAGSWAASLPAATSGSVKVRATRPALGM